MQQAYRVQTEDGAELKVCDYPSAGQTWDRETSDFRVWMPRAGQADTAHEQHAQSYEEGM